MPYGVLDQVKSRLHIQPTITTQDDELKRMISEADDFIDSQLGIFVSIPVVNAALPIVRMSNRLAAAWFIYWNTPAKERDMGPVLEIKKEIEQWVRAQYGKRTDTLSENTWGKAAGGILGTEG